MARHRIVARVGAALIALLAAFATAPPPAAADDQHPAAEAPARALLARQLALLDADKVDEFRTTLLAGARCHVPDRGMLPCDDINLSWFYPATRIRTKVRTLVVGATARSAWISGELDVATTTPRHSGDVGPAFHSYTQRIRLTALVVRDGDAWRGALFWVSTPSDHGINTDRATGTPGPLATWLDDPTAMAAGLDVGPSVTVFGTALAERAFGAKAAAKLLGRWKKLRLEVGDDAEEREFGDTAVVTATVIHLAKDGRRGFDTSAVFHRTDAGWRLVAVHYAGM